MVDAISFMPMEKNFLLDEKIEEGLESIKSFLNEMERHFQMKTTYSFPPSKKSAVCVRAQLR